MAFTVSSLLRAYKRKQPDPTDSAQQVSFGTSGHRGTSTNATFNDAHVAAITQAICEFRGPGAGPLYLGMDTHALSEPAQRTALEVLCANGVDAVVQQGGGFTPTPVISRAILVHNEGRAGGLADGIVITPSHNPPPDGGFKYNPPTGGPAGGDITGPIQKRANELLRGGNRDVKRIARPRARQIDLVRPYVDDLASVVDMAAIRASGLRIGADPLGGSSLAYWRAIQERWGVNIAVTNDKLDAEFAFMPPDHDGKIRMDCSSRHAMARLLDQQDRFDVAFGNDPDADRHGIVTPTEGLLNPNWYLAVAIDYLLGHRPDWPASAAVGKTVVSSSLIDRVVAARGRRLLEVPVGFKYFAGLHDSSLCFGGEESAGASFLRRDGRVWTTDKDGITLALLAAEITAVTGRDPGEHYRALTTRFGTAHYKRLDRPATPEIKDRLKSLRVSRESLAGNSILAVQTHCGVDPIGGVKVVTSNGWFAARPSGTENLYKLYTESFAGPRHRAMIAQEAEAIIGGD
jgi:phosphoglucomutase